MKPGTSQLPFATRVAIATHAPSARRYSVGFYTASGQWCGLAEHDPRHKAAVAACAGRRSVEIEGVTYWIQEA